MIRLPEREPPPQTQERLAKWQAELDGMTDYEQRVEAALRTFKQRSRTITFVRVREELARMCSGLLRCGYCEDSTGHQVEHIWPKSWYPELTYVWHNFLFSCGICNARKQAKFAILEDARLHELMRRRGEPKTPPPPGPAALIDPRREDPLDFLAIDLADTYRVLPRTGLDGLARLRASYTIELLELNRREVLVAGRRQACRDYSLRAREYVALGPDAPPGVRHNIIHELGRLHHRMVWEEMKRSPELVDGLRQQLDAAPELLTV